MADVIASAAALAIVASTPLLLAVLGELVVQRSGTINLGIEGMLLAAALSGAVVAHASGSAALGLAGGIAGALVIAALFGLFVITFRADQIVAGTAINLFALGATSFAFRELRDSALMNAPMPKPAFDWVTPAAWLLVPVVLGAILWRSLFGLRLRAAGENPDAASTAGARVSVHRWTALAIEALLVGVAGAHLAIALSSGFAENMSAGRGFIALAIVIFGRWRIAGALAGTAIFGIAAALQYAVQAAGTTLPFHLMLALPYVVTLLILGGVAGRVRAPEALGKR